MGELLAVQNYDRILKNEQPIDVSELLSGVLSVFLEEHATEIVERYEVARTDATRAYAARNVPEYIAELAGLTGTEVSDFPRVDLDTPAKRAALNRLVLGTGKRSKRAAAGLHREAGGVPARDPSDPHGAGVEDQRGSDADTRGAASSECFSHDVRRTLRTVEEIYKRDYRRVYAPTTKRGR